MGRPWREKFADAFRGVWLAARDGSSFVVHIVAAVIVVIAAILLKCDWLDWCLLVGCIGAVIAAEIFNASIETLFHALDADTKGRMTGCLDRAAGAVLVVALTAATIGAVVLGRRMLILLGTLPDA